MDRKLVGVGFVVLILVLVGAYFYWTNPRYPTVDYQKIFKGGERLVVDCGTSNQGMVDSGMPPEDNHGRIAYRYDKKNSLPIQLAEEYMANPKQVINVIGEFLAPTDVGICLDMFSIRVYDESKKRIESKTVVTDFVSGGRFGERATFDAEILAPRSPGTYELSLEYLENPMLNDKKCIWIPLCRARLIVLEDPVLPVSERR